MPATKPGLVQRSANHVGAVRHYLRHRRLRADLLPKALQADPVWDILLDLYAAHLDDKDVSVSSACMAAAVPPTTALRWLKLMARHRLIERVADLRDGRRVFVRLTGDAIDIVSQWVDDALVEPRSGLAHVHNGASSG